MNMMFTEAPAPGSLFDWRPDLERLRAEADAAAREHRTDPYTEVEAECWLDLVHAEMASQKERERSDPAAVAALKELRACEGELVTILRQLKRLEPAEKFSRAPLDAQDLQNQIIFRQPPERGLAPSRG